MERPLTSALEAATRSLAEELDASDALHQKAQDAQARGQSLRQQLAALPQASGGVWPLELLATQRSRALAVLQEHRQRITVLQRKLMWRRLRWPLAALVLTILVGVASFFGIRLYLDMQQAQQAAQAEKARAAVTAPLATTGGVMPAGTPAAQVGAGLPVNQAAQGSIGPNGPAPLLGSQPAPPAAPVIPTVPAPPPVAPAPPASLPNGTTP